MAMTLSPLLALFVVAAAGYVAGRVQIAGVGLGIAGVLFAGLALSALWPGIELPEIVPQLGLVLFIYSTGVASGPGLLRVLRARGVRDAALTVVALALAAVLTLALGRGLGLSAGRTAGLFAGALTNTPALAAVVQSLDDAGHSSERDEPVVAYSVAYPLGVLGLLLAMLVARRLFRREVPERPSLGGTMAGSAPLEVRTARVTTAAGATLGAIRHAHALRVAWGRHEHGTKITVAADDAVLAEGDLVSIVGTAAELARAVAAIGESSDAHPELDRHVLDFRRIFVSRPDVVERPLRALRLADRFGAAITRVRRGDVELLPTEELELELGDRVRVLAPRGRLGELSAFFGDSFHALAEVDVLTFGLGIVLGLLLGEIGVPLPGGPTFRLGIAGGPLVLGLILGHLGRLGPMVFTLPYSASVTLRQVGLLLFLAGVGLRSGGAFARTLASGDGVALLAAGALVTFSSALVTLAIAHRVLGLPFDVATGLVSGVHTQPAALAFATEQSKDELPRVGYASVFPVATVAKIVLAQLLVSWASGS